MSTEHVTRRQVFKVAAGTAGAAYLIGPALSGLVGPGDVAVAATTGATLTPELTEGPYWVNTLLRRSNVQANSSGTHRQAGVPLALTINIVNARDTPLNGLAVDIWHANAHGIYSDESSQAAGGGNTSAEEDTASDNFLRGYQITGVDKGIKAEPVDGQVSFSTIWPGWYASRAIHIHVRVRKLHSSGATIAGYTTQIFFSDADNDAVFAGAAPYNARDPQDDATTDENDSVLTAADYATNVVKVTGNLKDGFAATFNIVATNAEVATPGSLSRPSFGAGGGRGPGGGF